MIALFTEGYLVIVTGYTAAGYFIVVYLPDISPASWVVAAFTVVAAAYMVVGFS